MHTSEPRSSDPRSLAGRPVEKSKRLGQVFTPDPIAEKLVRRLLAGRPDRPVSILDPCVGPQTFPKQIIKCGLYHPGDKLTLIDLDDEMFAESKRWADAVDCGAKVLHGDYIELGTGGKYDYAVLNPPYLRQEWLDKKTTYQRLFRERYDLNPPGTSNLYVYFIVKVIKELKPGGAFACVVYDSWQSTKYGRWLREFIEESCEAVEVVPVHEQPFYGRLIDATLIFARKKAATGTRYPGESRRPECKPMFGDLWDVDGFSTIGEIYCTKRGLRLKQADFFLCDLSSCKKLGATPFVKKVGKVNGYAVAEDHAEAALLLKAASGHRKAHSELQRRLALALQSPEENVSILTWHRERPESWMVHRDAPYAPILFNYYIRKRPRHIYNASRVYADNFYGLTPPEGVSPFAALASLNSTAVCEQILACARNQGNGLAKIQLFEYRGVNTPDLTQCTKSDLRALDALGRRLVEPPDRAEDTLQKIDRLIADIYTNPKLEPQRVRQSYARADFKARRPKEV